MNYKFLQSIGLERYYDKLKSIGYDYDKLFNLEGSEYDVLRPIMGDDANEIKIEFELIKVRPNIGSVSSTLTAEELESRLAALA